MRSACALTPCSASEHAQRSAGDTHALRDGDEADADEREQAAAMPAESGERRQSDQSHSTGWQLICCPSFSWISIWALDPLLLSKNISLSLSRSLSQSIYLSVCLSIYFSLFQFLSLRGFSLSQSTSHSLSPSIPQSRRSSCTPQDQPCAARAHSRRAPRAHTRIGPRGALTDCGMATRRTQTGKSRRRPCRRSRATGGSQIRVIRLADDTPAVPPSLRSPSGFRFPCFAL